MLVWLIPNLKQKIKGNKKKGSRDERKKGGRKQYHMVNEKKIGGYKMIQERLFSSRSESRKMKISFEE